MLPQHSRPSSVKRHVCVDLRRSSGFLNIRVVSLPGWKIYVSYKLQIATFYKPVCCLTEIYQHQLLPPANEVWGKVMFLHLCVILFTGRGVSVPACITGHMTGGASLSRGSLSLGVSIWGVSVQVGFCRGGGALCPGGGLCQAYPSYGNEQAVRILMECILVHDANQLVIYL